MAESKSMDVLVLKLQLNIKQNELNLKTNWSKIVIYCETIKFSWFVNTFCSV
jgi:hypothetical protein